MSGGCCRGPHRRNASSSALWTSVRATRLTLSPDTMHRIVRFGRARHSANWHRSAAAVMCSTGNTSARYFFGQGGADSVCQYDEQDGLSVWKPTMAAYRRITTAAMRLKRIWRKRTTRRARVDRPQDHRNRPANRQYRHQYGHIRGRWYLILPQYCILDSHGNIVKQVHVSAGGQMRICDYQWTYDDAARTATCVDEAEGTTEKYWYDEQTLDKNGYSFSDGTTMSSVWCGARRETRTARFRTTPW